MIKTKIQSALAEPGESVLHRLYFRFEPLAEQYANRIFSEHKIGFEYEDLVQEFKIKIYTSIIGYAGYVKKKRELGYPVWPLELYLKRALSNKTKDFIKQIQDTPAQTVSVEADGFDYSVQHTLESHIILRNDFCQCEINGVDLLQGLTLVESKCFLLFLRGYTLNKLNTMFKFSVTEPSKMIRRQIALLQEKRAQLLENTTTKYMQYLVESEN